VRKLCSKKQSQAQTIQRTVASRNVIQNNGNIDKFWKGSRWFCRSFVIFYDHDQENSCLENCICVRAFKHRSVPNDQVLCTHCMLCLLQSWRFQLTALPGQTMQRAQNSYSITSFMRSLKHAQHTFALTKMRRCVYCKSPLFREIV